MKALAQLGTDCNIVWIKIIQYLLYHTVSLDEAIFAFKKLDSDSLVSQIQSEVMDLPNWSDKNRTSFNAFLFQYIRKSKFLLTFTNNIIKKFPIAMPCWNDNKENLFSFTNQTVIEIKDSVGECFSDFHYDAQVIRKEIRFTIDSLYENINH